MRHLGRKKPSVDSNDNHLSDDDNDLPDISVQLEDSEHGKTRAIKNPLETRPPTPSTSGVIRPKLQLNQVGKKNSRPKSTKQASTRNPAQKPVVTKGARGAKTKTLSEKPSSTTQTKIFQRELELSRERHTGDVYEIFDDSDDGDDRDGSACVPNKRTKLDPEEPASSCSSSYHSSRTYFRSDGRPELMFDRMMQSSRDQKRNSSNAR